MGEIDASDDISKAEALNSYYAEVFTRDNGVIPNSQPRMPMNSLTEFVVSDEAILDAVRKLNANGAPGSDCISPVFIKQVLPYLIVPLNLIFKCSLTQVYIFASSA